MDSLVLTRQPPLGKGLIREVSRSHTTTQHNGWVSSGRMISPSQRPLPDNTQHSQQTSMPPGGIRTHNLSTQAVADLRLRPRGYWDRQLWLVLRSIHPVTICLPIKKRPSTILPIDRDVTLMNFRSSKLFPVTRWRSVMDKR